MKVTIQGTEQEVEIDLAYEGITVSELRLRYNLPEGDLYLVRTQEHYIPAYHRLWMQTGDQVIVKPRKDDEDFRRIEKFRGGARPDSGWSGSEATLQSET